MLIGFENVFSDPFYPQLLCIRVYWLVYIPK